VASDTRAAFDDTDDTNGTNGTEPPETDTDAGNTGDAGDELDGRGREPDYYALLGVSPTASDVEIHHAFRRLAMLWHPDRFTAAPPVLRERAERRMRAVIRARDVLTNPISRHEYDARRSGPHTEPELHPDARPFAMPYTPPPFFGAGSMAHYERRAPNPNGAGQFFGALALILAIGLAAGALNGRFGSGAGAFIALIFTLGLFLLAGVLFTDETALARAATHFMEADPAPARPRRAPSRASMHRASHHHAGNHHKHVNQQAHDRAKTQAAPGRQYSGSHPDSGADGNDTAAKEHDRERPGDVEFDELVKQALAGVPDEFQPWLENVVVQVVREPSRRQLLEMQVRPNCTLLGLYVGVPVTHQAHFTGQGAPPEIISIFQGPIERYAGHDPERVKEQVRRTVLHEVAHHFGMSHEEMPAWIR
jgi:predicted Zn-dependent protease with MMP-like domain